MVSSVSFAKFDSGGQTPAVSLMVTLTDEHKRQTLWTARVRSEKTSTSTSHRAHPQKCGTSGGNVPHSFHRSLPLSGWRNSHQQYTVSHKIADSSLLAIAAY